MQLRINCVRFNWEFLTALKLLTYILLTSCLDLKGTLGVNENSNTSLNKNGDHPCQTYTTSKFKSYKGCHKSKSQS